MPKIPYISQSTHVMAVVRLWGLAVVLAVAPIALAADTARDVRLVRQFELNQPSSATTSNRHRLRPTDLVAVQSSAVSGNTLPGSPTLLIDSANESVKPFWLPLSVDVPLNLAIDRDNGRALYFDNASRTLLAIDIATASEYESVPLDRHLKGHAAGLALDPERRRVFVLDQAGNRILVIKAFASGQPVEISEIALSLPGASGLAFNPGTGRLYTLSQRAQSLYELAESGHVVAVHDLSALKLSQPISLSFAPSGDNTDDPAAVSLYVVSDARVSELNFQQPIARGGAITASLIRIIDGSLFDPPSPDTAGIAYVSHTDTLLVSDSEVNEMPLYEGANLFEINVIGNLLDTFTSTSFSNEPTGVAYNPSNKHVFISDDDKDEVFEIDPGPDQTLNTGDDVVTSFETDGYGSSDPEGITFDTASEVLFIVDGVDSEIYRVAPGNNQVFDGIPPDGDDTVTSFDTHALGVTDPEGITYRADTGDLLIVGSPRDLVVQLSTTGTLVQSYDTSAAHPLKPAGLAFGPSSIDSTTSVIYIAARGVDNDSDPDENDGTIYELSLAPIVPSNQPATVDAGADQTVVLPDIGVLYGSVSDSDGPGPLTSQWYQVSGPAASVFDTPNSALTTVSFPNIGTYVLRVIANDGELLSSDDAIVEVTNTGNPPTVEISSPSNGSGFVQGSMVTFAGTATSTTMGDLSANLNWLSSLDGLIGSGASFSTNTLSIGSHTVTAAATDGNDLTGTDQVDITVGTNTAPVATITSPADGSPFNLGDLVTFVGTGTDNEDGDVTASLAWVSSLDGAIGSGASFAIDTLTAGTHTITATATDSGGLVSSDQITLTVNGPPSASISQPLDGATVNLGDLVTFTGTGSDNEDGDVTASLAWESDLDGAIGSGATFAIDTLTAGTHTITATATDSGGLVGSDQITLTIMVIGDSDGDGTSDALDNCTNVPNGPTIPDAGGNIQRDTDGDGFGNVCDGDFNGNCSVNAGDLGYLKSVFFTSDPDADLNGDGVVNTIDLGLFKTLFFQTPGPSALATCP